MKYIIGTILLLIGLVFLGRLIIKEQDKMTYWKIVVAASCGVSLLGGLLILMI